MWPLKPYLAAKTKPPAIRTLLRFEHIPLAASDVRCHQNVLSLAFANLWYLSKFCMHSNPACIRVHRASWNCWGARRKSENFSSTGVSPCNYGLSMPVSRSTKHRQRFYRISWGSSAWYGQSVGLNIEPNYAVPGFATHIVVCCQKIGFEFFWLLFHSFSCNSSSKG